MDQERIYAEHAAEYDALVGAEDCDGHLLPAIEAVAPLPGASVLEVGAGTGFFFGEAFGDRVRREGWRRVPECTGIWWRRV